MRLALEDLQREAAATGFQAETLEKAIRLLSLLDAMRSHPYLRTRLALKGGTALNLFVFDTPRLSVDIDLNYVGALDREVMLAERPRVEDVIQAVCGREGLAMRRVPAEHAGGKWRLTYLSARSRSGNLEVAASADAAQRDTARARRGLGLGRAARVRMPRSTFSGVAADGIGARLHRAAERPRRDRA